MDVCLLEPLPRLTVAFPFASDESGLVDGVRIVTPQVSVLHCYHDKAMVTGDYLAVEGYYEQEQE